MEAVADGEAEPRETVSVRATAPDATTASVLLTIPRNGYEWRVLRAPLRVLAGDEALVEAELNAPAPMTAALGVRMGRALSVRFSGGVLSSWTIAPGSALLSARTEIPPGGMTGSIALRPRKSGPHIIHLFESEFSRSAPGDQQFIRTSTPAFVLHADARPVTLQAELEQEILAEGETAALQLSAAGLPSEGSVQLHIRSDPAEDVRLSTAIVTLSAAAPTAEALATARADGLPEPREEVQLEAWAAASSFSLAAATAVISLTIPRHGYEVSGLQASEEGRLGAAFSVRAELNAPAPVAAQLTLRAVAPSGNALTEQLTIGADESGGDVSFTPQEAGVWRISVTGAEFVSSESGDQTDLPLPAQAAQLNILAKKALQLSLAQRTLAEGETTRLEVRALNLLADESLEANLAVGAPYEAELRLSADTVELTARTPTAEVELSAAPDSLTEPREIISLRATAESVDSTSVSLAVPRHGYEVSGLQAPEEGRLGAVFSVRAELNAPAPVAAQLTLKAVAPSGNALTEQLTIGADESGGDVFFTPQEAGVWRVSVTGAEFVSSESGDQTDLTLPAQSAQLNILAEKALQLGLAQRTLAEGETTRLEVRALNLLADESLEANLAVGAPYEADLRLSADTVKLTARTPTAEVELSAAPDSLTEPREVISLRATAESVDSTSVSLAVPRHGYEVSGLQAPEEGRLGAVFSVRAELNAPAPVAAQLTLRAVAPSGNALTEQLTIGADESGGDVSFIPEEPGVWRVSVTGAEFVSSESGDQTDLPLSAQTARIDILVKKALRLDLVQQTLAEGETMQLEVRGLNLLTDESIEASLAVSAPYEADLRLSADTVELTARTPTVEVELSAVEDALAEGRETLGITATAPGAGSAAVSLAIPRHGYEVSEWQAPEEMTAWEDATVEAQLNAPAPAEAFLTVQAALQPASAAAPLTAQLRIAAGAVTGGVSFAPQEAGLYALSLTRAEFTTAEAGDQRNLPALAPSPARELRVNPRQVELRIAASSAVLTEGESAVLQVEALNLPAGQSLLAGLAVAAGHEKDVTLESASVRLSSEAPTAEVEAKVARDGLPESREALFIEARVLERPSGTEAQAARAEFAIARNDYAVKALRLSAERLPAGGTLRVEAELNAPALAPINLEMQVRQPPDGEPLIERLTVAAGARTAAATFLLEDAGSYRVRLTEAVFAPPVIDGDQTRLDVSAVTDLQAQASLRQAEVRLQLDSTELEEGETAQLRVSAAGLTAGDVLEVRLQSDHAQDLAFNPSAVRLEGPSWAADADVTALEDSRPEPAEAITLRAELNGELPRSVEVTQWGRAALRIPGHGYRIQAFHVPQNTESGETADFKLELNAEAPEALQWTVRARLLEDEGVDVPLPAPGIPPLTAPLRIAPGQSSGHAQLVAEESGLYQVSLHGPDATALEIPLRPTERWRVHPRPVKLYASLKPEVLLEGATVTLLVRAEKLRVGESLEIVVSSPEEDLRFSPERTELRADVPTATVFVTLRENANARLQSIARVDVRGTVLPGSNRFASAEPLDLELRRRTPLTMPRLLTGAPGPYELWVSWTYAQAQTSPGEEERAPLTAAEAYMLLYAEAAGNACPDATAAYRNAVVRHTPTKNGREAQVQSEYADGTAVQADTLYCFRLRVRDGERAEFTAALPLRTPAYEPGLNLNTDELPDHLEALCGAACTALEAPQEDDDRDGINNALETLLKVIDAEAEGEDAYSDTDKDGVPDIIELHYGGRIGEQNLASEELRCDAGAYLTRLTACGAGLEGMHLQIAMDARGRGVYRGGAAGLAVGEAHRVDKLTRLNSGTHWLLDTASRTAVKLEILPLLSLNGSKAVVLTEGDEASVDASYTAALTLLGPLLQDAPEVSVKVCREPSAGTDFTDASGFNAVACPTPEELEPALLGTQTHRHAWSLNWRVSRAEDEGKTLRLRAEVAGGGPVSEYSFSERDVLPVLEAELLFLSPQITESGVEQQLIPYLADAEGERAGSAANGADWRFRAEPRDRITEVKQVCAMGMGGEDGPVSKQFIGLDVEDGQIVLEEVDEFGNQAVRVKFYSDTATECGARGGTDERFLGELSFLVGEEDRDGNLVPDEEEEAEAPVDATGEKGLRYSPTSAEGGEEEKEYYLRSHLSLRLGMEAAEQALGSPNLEESGERETANAPDDSLQIVDGVVLDFETFCAQDPQCLRAGEPVQLVFEVSRDIPSEARYYKRRKDVDTGETTWCPLTVQYDGGQSRERVPPGCESPPENYRGRDGAAFAAREESGECPAPGSEAYEPSGVSGAPYLDTPASGEQCVQLTLTDNGPNDDNPVSGVVADPGAILAPAPVSAPPPAPAPARPAPQRSLTPGAAADGGGGGGGGGGVAGWPTLLLLFALLVRGILRRGGLRRSVAVSRI